MKFTISKSSPEKFKTDIIAIGCYERSHEDDENKKLPALIKHSDGGTRLDRALGGTISKQIYAEKFTGTRGTHRLFFTAGKIPAKFILIIGLGPQNKFDLEVIREAGSTISKIAREVLAISVGLVLEQGPLSEEAAVDRARAITEGVVLGNYEFNRYKTGENQKKSAFGLTTFLYRGNAQTIRSGIALGEIYAEATCFCRDLVNTPSTDATPTDLATVAQTLANEHGLKCHIMETEEIRKARLNGILAVSKGSSEPPSFIVLKYTPKEKPRARIALVGKGVTFDSGGISLKPARGEIKDMKSDMAGAAAVLGCMKAIAKLTPSVEVTGYIPAAENMPDGRAFKLGDIYKAHNGKTIEVLNMDAEGRLILADALSYATDHNPDVIVDIATLTGGAAYCCGELFTIILGNDQKIVDKLRKAAESCGEYMWQLPMVEQYKKGYTSGIADLNNIGKGKAQTILGALFLREFVKDVPWAHMDIAASSWTDEELPTSEKGATGAMVRTLISFVMGFKKPISEQADL